MNVLAVLQIRNQVIFAHWENYWGVIYRDTCFYGQVFKEIIISGGIIGKCYQGSGMYILKVLFFFLNPS